MWSVILAQIASRLVCAAWCVTSGSGWLQSSVADNSRLRVTYNWYKMRQGLVRPAVHIDEPKMKALE